MFVCTLETGEFNANFFVYSHELAVLFPVGYDPDSKLTYFAHVGFSPMAGGDLEYYFVVTEVDGETEQEHDYWSGEDVARIIPEDDRSSILRAICSATEALLHKAKPHRVFRCTRDRYLPEKALEKHFAISKVFTACGYDVTATDEYHGKRAWWATRR